MKEEMNDKISQELKDEIQQEKLIMVLVLTNEWSLSQTMKRNCLMPPGWLEMSREQMEQAMIQETLKINKKVVKFLNKCPRSEWLTLTPSFSTMIGSFTAKLTPKQIVKLSKFNEVKNISLRITKEMNVTC